MDRLPDELDGSVRSRAEYGDTVEFDVWVDADRRLRKMKPAGDGPVRGLEVQWWDFDGPADEPNRKWVTYRGIRSCDLPQLPCVAERPPGCLRNIMAVLPLSLAANTQP